MATAPPPDSPVAGPSSASPKWRSAAALPAPASSADGRFTPQRRLSSDSQALEDIEESLYHEKLRSLARGGGCNGGNGGGGSGSSASGGLAGWPRRYSPSVGCGGGGAGDGFARGKRKARAVAALAAASAASSLVIALAASRAGGFPPAALPAVEYFWATLLSRGLHAVATWKGRRWDGFNAGAVQGFRETWRYAAPCGLVGALALWCRVEAASRIGLGVQQALELFAAPLILALSRPLGLDHISPSPRLHLVSSLIALTTSLALLSQFSALHGLILAFLSTFLQALHFSLIKRWLVAEPTTPAQSVVHHSAPFGLALGGVAILVGPVRQSASGVVRPSYGGPPRLSRGASAWLVAFVTARTLEWLCEVQALDACATAVGSSLVGPARNLLALAVAPLAGVATGLGSAAQFVGMYVVDLWMLAWADPEVRSRVPGASALGGNGAAGAGSPDLEPDPLPLAMAVDSKPPPSYRESHRSPSLYPGAATHWPSTEPALAPLTRRLLCALAFGPLALWFLQQLGSDPSGSPPRPAAAPARRAGSFDVVFAYYNEPRAAFKATVANVRSTPEIATRDARVIVYVKDAGADLQELADGIGADEVIRLVNEGREGDTYLTHILRHYNESVGVAASSPGSSDGSSASLGAGSLDNRPELGSERVVKSEAVGLADHTLFMQPHLSWHWIGQPRLEMFDAHRTGYLSLGPYLSSDCGEDGLGNGNYGRMRDIYALFHETFCPPTRQLATYAGQFIVSRRRILINSYSKYASMRSLITAPAGHWLHKEGWWFRWQGSGDDAEAQPDGPVTPFLGHALERSWPSVFRCGDPMIAELCSDDKRNPEKDKWVCQCFDPPGEEGEA